MAVVIGVVVGFAAGWAAHTFLGPTVDRFIRPSASTNQAPIHTAKAESGWAVEQEGRAEPLAQFPTKAEAQAAGREIAKEAGADHIVHKSDGTVGEERHYGEKAD